ncbi:MAG: hypothetical protein C7B47_17250 [Sulfobacillus thermosulfidooxidans]|uniref:Uncharacterized protein n=1 Tax=Sulfobacillus thermosulfidooxidans TaxID=28034 RepID=A0A2T2WH56_SULTH|nr:MAG: hypothetical protein C7B47_17250 [Sulfobacillus thermosulfidooxidans]
MTPIKFWSASVLAVVLASGLAGCGTPQAAGQTATKKPGTPKTTAAPMVAAPPLSEAKTNPVAYITQYDEHGMEEMLHQYATDIPGVALTGPNAGTFTLQALNGPLQKKYGGPTVPATLAAAGVHIPNLPPDNSVLGVSAFVQAEYPRLQTYHMFPGMSEAVFQAGLEQAVAFENWGNGNDPAKIFLTMLGPVHSTTSSTTGVESLEQAGLAADYSASPTLGNAPQRQYTYDAWGQITSPRAQHFAVDAIPWKLMDGVLPPGMSTPRWTMELDNVVQAHAVYATWDHGQYRVGMTSYTVPQIILSYFSNGQGGGAWFVVDAQSSTHSQASDVHVIKTQ